MSDFEQNSGPTMQCVIANRLPNLSKSLNAFNSYSGFSEVTPKQ